MTADTSSVYVIASIDNSKIKIGKANDVLKRIEAFSYVQIDYHKSFEIVCRDEKAAHKIEKMLHNRFDDYRLLSVDIGKFDGSTEWFSYDIYDQIEKFINDSNDERMLTVRIGIQPFQKQNTSKKRNYYTKEERKLKQEQQWLENDIVNEKKIYIAIEIIKDLHAIKNIRLFSVAKNLEEVFYCLYLEIDDTVSDILKKKVMQLRGTCIAIPNGKGDLCESVMYTSENSHTSWIYEAVIGINNPFFNFPLNSKTLSALYMLKQTCSELFEPITDFEKIPGIFLDHYLLTNNRKHIRLV